MGGDFDIERGDDFRGSGFVFEVGGVLQNFTCTGDAGLEALGGAEFTEQTVLERDFLGLVNDGVGFFKGNLKVAVLLQLAFGRFPPFFPIILDDVRDKHGLDLVHGGPAAVTFQDEFDEFEMVQGGHLAEAFEIGGLAGENMVLGDGLEGLRGKGEIHSVAGLAREINGEAGKDGVHRGDFPKAPTAVHAITARSKLDEWIDLASIELARRHHFLKLFFHKTILFLASIYDNVIINRRERAKTKTNCRESAGRKPIR